MPDLPRRRPFTALRRLRTAIPDVRSIPGRFRQAYGAGPLHLLGVIACFALAGYAVLRIPVPLLPRILIWFGAAVIGHDLILFPLYALADRSLTVTRRRAVPVINHIRVPALGAGLLLLIFLPDIIRQGAPTFVSATGKTQQPYLGRWLLLTAAMFGISAIIYGIRIGRPYLKKPHFSLQRLRPGRSHQATRPTARE